jgi:hypothetical protein
MKPTRSSVIVTFSPCYQLSQVHCTFWRTNSLLLLPQTFFIANDLKLNLNSRVYSLDVKEQVHEIYQYNLDDTKYTYKTLGNTNSPEFHQTVKYIWERRTDLSTIHLDIIYITQPQFTMINSAHEITGYLGELFVALQEKFQFQFSLLEQIDQCWGILLGNGSYSCMFGKLQRGESNWSLAGRVKKHILFMKYLAMEKTKRKKWFRYPTFVSS